MLRVEREDFGPVLSVLLAHALLAARSQATSFQSSLARVALETGFSPNAGPPERNPQQRWSVILVILEFLNMRHIHPGPLRYHCLGEMPLCSVHPTPKP